MSTGMTWIEIERPTLETPRLILRPFLIADAKAVQAMAGHPDVAATTATIPHPYPDGAAEEWIGLHAEWFEQKRSVQFAITLKANHELIGCIDLLGYSPVHRKAEMGYWVGVAHWNHGYCTEAAAATVKYGFERMNLNKITARHLGINPSSGRVMSNVGMKKEGVLRQEFVKNGAFHDMVVYGITKADFQSL